MPSYLCIRCGFKTKRRMNFKRHLTRKHICIPINRDISIKDIAESYGIDISPTEIRQEDTNAYTTHVDTHEHTSNTIGHKEHLQHINGHTLMHTRGNIDRHIPGHTQGHTQGHKEYMCKYCNKSFNSSTSRCRHQRNYCKYKNREVSISRDEIEKIKKDIEKKAEKKIKEAEDKVDVLADQKAQKMVLCLIDKLIPNKTTNNTNTNSFNKINNTQNNNTLINNNTQHLKINNFGKENTKYITDAQLKIMFVDPRNTVIQHIKDTHYHVLHPENYNAKITNHKSKHMKVYEDNEWITVNKRATICSMYNKHEKIMNTEFERLKPELSEKVREKYNEYKRTAHSNYHTYQQRLIDTEAAIITGTQRQKNIDLLRKEEVLRLAKEQNKTPSEIFAEHMPDIFGERDDE